MWWNHLITKWPSTGKSSKSSQDPKMASNKSQRTTQDLLPKPKRNSNHQLNSHPKQPPPKPTPCLPPQKIHPPKKKTYFLKPKNWTKKTGNIPTLVHERLERLEPGNCFGRSGRPAWGSGCRSAGKPTKWSRFHAPLMAGGDGVSSSFYYYVVEGFKNIRRENQLRLERLSTII